jgi:hypothetical protein
MGLAAHDIRQGRLCRSERRRETRSRATGSRRREKAPSKAQPLREIVVEKEIDKPVVPISVEAEIRKRTDRWSWLTTIFGSGGAGLAALAGMDWQIVMAIGALAFGGLLIALLLRRQIVVPCGM